MKLGAGLIPMTMIMMTLAVSSVHGSQTKKKHKKVPQAKVQKLQFEDMDLNEQALTAKEPTFPEIKLSGKIKRAPSSVATAKIDGPGPQLVGAVDTSDEADDHDREERAKVLGAAVPAGQALNDVENAQRTLDELKEEKKAKKLHVKTKEELREEHEEQAYRQAINKATKAAAKNGKPQIVQTPKGKVKMVFINESEFADNKTDGASPQLKEAIKGQDRAPASIDDQIDSVTQ